MIDIGRGILQIEDGSKYIVDIYNVRQRYGEPLEIHAVLVNSFGVSNFLRKTLHIADEDQIKQVIFNDPATIVIWADGTKTIVKCQPGDVYDAEKGLALCIAKKFFGNKGNFNEVFKKWIPKKKPSHAEVKNETNILVEKMRDKLQEYCQQPRSCRDCLLHAFRCGNGKTFKTSDEYVRLSDDEVREAYKIVFGNKEV